MEFGKPTCRRGSVQHRVRAGGLGTPELEVGNDLLDSVGRSRHQANQAPFLPGPLPPRWRQPRVVVELDLGAVRLRSVARQIDVHVDVGG